MRIYINETVVKVKANERRAHPRLQQNSRLDKSSDGGESKRARGRVEIGRELSVRDRRGEDQEEEEEEGGEC